ncbi:cell wall galactomannoprotein Mp2/allergen F17-like protein [Purpureocillium lavendulum]|uniref:Cell wall galactomannoprotein Mp2/allergen F17-like protein n=1 Tax=Purpureocillium lavendulum TaxID=1247861 RepID=A0AB34G051_9HYPO|nr:cell wall galactomannoprotein Mp2/allergen F17-like protein [Purpureocillium lavendulum]
MAAVPRTRPAGAAPSSRLPANSSRPIAHQSSSGGISGSSASQGTGPSPVAVFLTNLRLLDLDLLPDWPGISAETFATTGASVQGQKRRIHCVEWALFRLFSLWDPEETANKLKPFFPPLDQIQSVNLRAALLRALENAKKNGVLGRDSVIRKTMLDECKGERLEEVLAVLSTAVLKLVTATEVQDGRAFPAVALELALENRGYSADNTQLRLLSLAHKVHIRQLLETKSAARARYADFADLLSVKERGVERRLEMLRAKERSGADKEGTLSNTAREEMRRTLRNNWTGNENWMQALLLGDSGTNVDGSSGLFAMPVDRVWRRVEQGRLSELEQDDGGLLDQLDSRVKAQKERLAKWEALRANMSRNRQGQVPTASPSKRRAQAEKQKSTKGIDLKFGQHQELQVGKIATLRKVESRSGQESHMVDEYRDLVEGLKHELAQIRGSAQGTALTSLLTKAQKQTYHKDEDETDEEDEVSEMSELDDDGEEPQPRRPEPAIAKRLPVRPQLAAAHDSDQASASAFSAPPRRVANPAHELLDHDEEPLDASRRRSLWDSSPPSSPSPSKRSPTRRPVGIDARQRAVHPVGEVATAKQPSLDTSETPTSPTQQLADQILESIHNASPSPTKRSKPRHTLSLAQRTRLSMARTNPFLDGEDEDPVPALSANPNPAATTLSGPGRAAKKPSPPIPEVEEPPQEPGPGDEDDLVARTRRSMAGLEKAKQKAQLERRRSLRKSKLPPPRRDGSLFPKLTEEPEAGDDTVALAEELMGEEDMEAVFRSRPKIKTSPLGSPSKMDDGWP